MSWPIATAAPGRVLKQAADGRTQLNDDQRSQCFGKTVRAMQMTASRRRIRKLLSNHDDSTDHGAARLQYAYAPVRLALDELLMPDAGNRIRP